MLGFVLEIVFNLFLLFTRKFCIIKFCSTSLAKYKSSHSQMFFKMASKWVFLKVLQPSQENACAGVSFLINCRLKARNLVKKILQHRCFYVKFAKFFTTTFVKEHLRCVAASVNTFSENCELQGTS